MIKKKRRKKRVRRLASKEIQWCQHRYHRQPPMKCQLLSWKGLFGRPLFSSCLLSLDSLQGCSSTLGPGILSLHLLPAGIIDEELVISHGLVCQNLSFRFTQKSETMMKNLIRLATFDEWPPGLSQRPQEMAEAGLIYLGRAKM